MRDEEERQLARRVYYAQCNWLDDNVGKIVTALEAHGLWGKGNMYEESVTVPILLAPPPGDAAPDGS